MPNFFDTPLTTFPRRLADLGANMMDNPQGEGSWGQGLAAGSLQGVGDLISNATTPENLIYSSLGLPFAGRIRSMAKIKNIAKLANESKAPQILGDIVRKTRQGVNKRLPSLAKNRIRMRERVGYDVPNNPTARALEAERLEIQKGAKKEFFTRQEPNDAWNARKGDRFYRTDIDKLRRSQN